MANAGELRVRLGISQAAIVLMIAGSCQPACCTLHPGTQTRSASKVAAAFYF
jgi:hypothetical protein